MSFNYLSSEEAVAPTLNLLRLEQLLIYGNPILGPSGEDSLGIYIEDLLEAAENARIGASRPPLEIITEIPCKKKRGKYERLGRQQAYKKFSVKKIKDRPVFTQKREDYGAATKTLFQESIDLVRRERKREKTGRGTEKERHTHSMMTPDLTFLTNQGARIDEEDQQEENEEQEEEEAEEMPVEYRGTFSMEALMPSEGGVGNRVPDGLFGANLSGPDQSGAPPAPLASALKALRFALNHPMTDYNEVPSRGFQSTQDYAKPNKLTIIRQLPRRSYKEQSDRLPISRLGSTNTKGDRKMRNRTLHQIESVLDSLNENTGKDVIHKKKSGGYITGEEGDETVSKQVIHRPHTGIKKLVTMVTEVVSETQS
eukprot:CAMPEP_0182419950 /NCGR_PEP_ID=MMETSP1167-20130531/4318_1 /TAXON_ID=2988 /ORGANISM="Mallomonas Sp, Strain CCMP3275" /LENGTH=368 /DNA_ID=CAMNT_0024595193 /DNA_START=162 /DNA_END=1268 /DNA_ORIENTATION=-